MNPSIEWRKSSERLQSAAEILSDPRFVEMMKVMYAEHPMVTVTQPKDGCESTSKLGEIMGYQLFISKLNSLREPIPSINAPIEATWSADNIESVNIKK